VSGHIRGSIHSMHIAVPEFLRLHRGQPVLFVNDGVAAARGIADGDTVRLFNDVDSAELMVSTSAAVGPDQVVVYMWESFQFAGWKSHDAMLVGMPKAFTWPAATDSSDTSSPVDRRHPRAIAGCASTS